MSADSSSTTRMERKRETRASGLEEEKADKELEEGGKTKQDKMEGLEENEDNKSLHADKVDDETFYNDSSSLALKWNQKKAGGLTLSSRTAIRFVENT